MPKRRTESRTVPEMVGRIVKVYRNYRERRILVGRAQIIGLASWSAQHYEIRWISDGTHAKTAHRFGIEIDYAEEARLSGWVCKIDHALPPAPPRYFDAEGFSRAFDDLFGSEVNKL